MKVSEKADLAPDGHREPAFDGTPKGLDAHETHEDCGDNQHEQSQPERSFPGPTDPQDPPAAIDAVVQERTAASRLPDPNQRRPGPSPHKEMLALTTPRVNHPGQPASEGAAHPSAGRRPDPLQAEKGAVDECLRQSRSRARRSPLTIQDAPATLEKAFDVSAADVEHGVGPLDDDVAAALEQENVLGKILHLVKARPVS